MNQTDSLMMPLFRRKDLIKISRINHHSILTTKLHRNSQVITESIRTIIIPKEENHRSWKTSIKVDSHSARVKSYHFPYKDCWKTDTIQTLIGTRLWIILKDKLGITRILSRMATSTAIRYCSVILQRSQQFESNRIFSRNTETSRFRCDLRTRPTDTLFYFKYFYSFEKNGKAQTCYRSSQSQPICYLSTLQNEEFRFNQVIKKQYYFTCLPFGLMTSSRIFTKILKPIIKMARARGIQVVAYLNDLLIIVEFKEEALEKAK
ncbi:DNA-dependent protein kinase catalytic subunit [Rhizophagus irregularis DAOM 181602=DAOM 197198]|nr:DNA-dependent protein kinase catalytic subunit [Rhizophagus irregularis DAOM 181602=DAOM 197198]